tara:strand:- start:380 stop:538 length:159 start_codon:yes stop_codon:yes gene_type:complete
MTTYKIVRFYKSRYKNSRVIRRGLTLEEAKEHCQDPSTSGLNWFDGFTKEEN